MRERCLIYFLETPELINDRLDGHLQIIHLCFKLLQISIFKPSLYSISILAHIHATLKAFMSKYMIVIDSYFLNEKTIEGVSLDMLRYVIYFFET